MVFKAGQFLGHIYKRNILKESLLGKGVWKEGWCLFKELFHQCCLVCNFLFQRSWYTHLHRIISSTHESIRQTLEPFQRQHWGNFWEMRWIWAFLDMGISGYGHFWVHRHHLELDWTELMSQTSAGETHQQVKEYFLEFNIPSTAQDNKDFAEMTFGWLLASSQWNCPDERQRETSWLPLYARAQPAPPLRVQQWACPAQLRLCWARRHSGGGRTASSWAAGAGPWTTAAEVWRPVGVSLLACCEWWLLRLAPP